MKKVQEEKKEFDVIIRVQMSQRVTVEESSKEKAIESAMEQYNNGEIMPYLKDSEYYDGVIEVTAYEVE